MNIKMYKLSVITVFLNICRIIPFAESINETSVAIYELEAKVTVQKFNNCS